jgi:hypothetical protein
VTAIEFEIDCPRCATTDSVTPRALLAAVAVESANPNVAGSVAWICPVCRDLVAAAVAWEGLRIALDAGVPLIEEPEDLALSEHPEQPQLDAPDFSHDDVLEMHELLATDDWFHRLDAA